MEATRPFLTANLITQTIICSLMLIWKTILLVKSKATLVQDNIQGIQSKEFTINRFKDKFLSAFNKQGFQPNH